MTVPANLDEPRGARQLSRIGTVPLLAGLFTLYVGWGSTFPAMRVALRTMPPFMLASARCLFAGLVLMAFARWRNTPMPSAIEWRGAFGVGVLSLGFGHGLVSWGVGHVPGGTAAILVSMSALWIAILAWALLGEAPGYRAIIGLIAGFAGLIIVAGSAFDGRYDPLAILALVIAPICWAWGSVRSRRVSLPRGTLMSTAAQLLAAAPVVALLSAVSGEWGQLTTEAFSRSSLLAFAYLTLFGYVLVFTVYTWLLKFAPMSTVGTYAYVNPLVAVLLGVTLLAEALTVGTMLGGSVILVGVALVVIDGARGRHLRVPGPESPATVTEQANTWNGQLSRRTAPAGERSSSPNGATADRLRS